MLLRVVAISFLFGLLDTLTKPTNECTSRESNRGNWQCSAHKNSFVIDQCLVRQVML